MMEYILELYIPEIGNWGEVVVPEVNDGVHCHWVRYRGEDTSPIESEDERIKRYDANEKAYLSGTKIRPITTTKFSKRASCMILSIFNGLCPA